MVEAVICMESRLYLHAGMQDTRSILQRWLVPSLLSHCLNLQIPFYTSNEVGHLLVLVSFSLCALMLGVFVVPCTYEGFKESYY